ncbi:MAG: Do family serine endopeptidase [Calditrichaeota bacterium]|nr:Do family serine endopeptidase [Calditrichota bacterium]
MPTTKRNALFIVTAIFLGVIIGLAISTNFGLIWNSIASDHSTKEAPAAENSVATAQASDEGSESAVQATDDSSLPQGLLDLEKAYISVAKRVKPTVVTITSEKYIKYHMNNPFQDFFGSDFFDFFNRRGQRQNEQQGRERTYVQEGLGSGVLVSSDGYILTNNHVVKEADQIRVITNDGKEYEAKLIGRDEKTDVAVVKIDDKNLPFAKLGNSDKIEVGQIVLAVGNPFSKQLQSTVTNGIISAKGRSGIGLGASYQDYIQTTAAINPGNSGGALVNLHGELIGINTAIISQSGGFNGIGFAIPVNMAKHIMNILIKKGYVVRGYLGVIIQPVDEDMAEAFGLKSGKGALISSVQKGTPAEKAGLKERDIVVAIDGHPVKDNTELQLKVADYEPGTTVKLKVFRDGKYLTVPVKLGQRPGDHPVSESKEPQVEKLGIHITNLAPAMAQRYGFEDSERGVLVTSVERTSQAYRKGIREGDLITAINQTKIKSVRDYDRYMRKVKKGDILVIRLKKNLNGTVSNYYVTVRISD